MTNIKAHIIAIDGAKGSGKKTLCLELALALLYSSQKTAIALSPDSPLHETLNNRQNSAPFLPQIPIINLFNIENFLNTYDAILIPNITPESKLAISAKTYITMLHKSSSSAKKFQQNKNYLNAMWELKKKIASTHNSSLNWVVCENNLTFPLQETPSEQLTKISKLYGFRTTVPLNKRIAYQNNLKGISAQDKSFPNLQKELTYDDICARREILKLAEFIFS